jgi:hypothetical protein
LKLGDAVAIHWGMIVKILTKTEEKNLRLWTNRVLQSFS